MTLQYRPSDGALLYKGCDSRHPLQAECCCFQLVCTDCANSFVVTLDLDAGIDASAHGAHTLARTWSDCLWQKIWAEIRGSDTWNFAIYLAFQQDWVPGSYPNFFTRPGCVWNVLLTVDAPGSQTDESIQWYSRRSTTCPPSGALQQWYSLTGKGGTCVIS